ncbi:MAG: terpene cyclase/mutase family protein [Verrucomicrobia bacterium]|nr:terpene cyclase/mutase family protein [Verrucomicrobiota bacterium]
MPHAAIIALAVAVALVQSTFAQQLFIEKSDINPTTIDAMYVKGLRFLVKTQAREGNWKDQPYGSEPAVVGLTVVAMLAHGDDPNYGPYNLSIRKGLEFILAQQNKDTGYIGRSMYNHGFAALALAEAYGAVDDARLGPALQKAVNLILTSQSRNPYSAWRYSPESNDADTTVSGAQMVALFAARNAGIAVPEDAIQKGLKYFTTCQSSDGGIGYTSAAGPNGARTAIAALCFALAKEKTNPAFKSAIDYLERSPGEGHYYHYYLYYAAQAHFHASPASWRTWNTKNIKTLSASQTAEGSWEGQFGSTFSTTASLLSLALNYRFLPIYER